jgi:beta-phosphoglucomutase
MPLRALIFDLDGTLTESDGHHAAAYISVMADHGLVLDQATYLERMSGRPNLTIVEEFLPHLSPSEALAVIDDKEARYRRLATRLEPLPGVVRTLAWADARALALAVVTNAPRENLDFALAALGFEGTFAARVSPEEVESPKPAPDAYLLALERLGVAAGDSLAF